MTLSKLRPLDVKFLFDDRPYRLGETINVMVELGARGEVEVREARLDLVCEEHYVESYTTNVPVGPRADTGAPPGLGGLYSSATVPKEVHKDIRESYVHSGEVFLTNSLLSSSAVNQYSVRLGVGTERPPHAGIATVKWRLELVADIARARDIRARHKVNVLLS